MILLINTDSLPLGITIPIPVYESPIKNVKFT